MANPAPHETKRPSSSDAAPRRIGEALVSAGHITDEQLADALAAQARSGARLGRVLLTHGVVRRQALFSTMAELWGVGFVDLMTDRPDAELMSRVPAQEMLDGGWVPLRVKNVGAFTVADVAVCEQPGEDTSSVIAEALGVDVVILHATTDFDIDVAVMDACGEEIAATASDALADSRPDLSAFDPVVRWQKVAGLAVVVAVVVFTWLDWRVTLSTALVIANVVFAVGVSFKFVVCIKGMWALRRRHRSDDDPDDVERIPDALLPVVTILVPVYKEANVVAEVVEHVSALDYPQTKIQVLVLCEADDVETLAAAKAANPPEFVRLVVVAPGGPQTKPRACNAGLAFAEGEFLVIYDAEDRPEPGQLREMVAAFAAADNDVICHQARLNYFNATENVLTRMFTLEYSLWFDYMLPGLDALRLPIPLGGTSNHFRTDALRELGAWDPYNVTEDADLGVRATAEGHRVGIIDSTTWEEACSEWTAWVRQRTRWIKGYMVTALVHLRNPVTSWRRLGFRGMFGLIGLIAATPALFCAAPLVWGFFLYTFLGGVVPGFQLPAWLGTTMVYTFVLGNGSMILLTALAARRRKLWNLVGYAILNPLYWVLHSIAAWRALYQLVVKPSHWEKTPHGLVHGPEEKPST